MKKELVLSLVAVLSMYGCGDDTRPPVDSSVDSGVDSGADSGVDSSVIDSGTDADMDAATDADMDGSTDADMDGSTDAATDADMDAMTDAMDAMTDAATPGGGAATSTQIQAVRDATVGTLALPVDDALVSYVKPATGSDVAGFFVQAEQTGPAIFVAVDPATLTPVPAVGSVVSFQVDETVSTGGHLEVSMLSSFAEASNGHDVSFLIQDVSAATDVVSALDSYESELVRITGDLGAFSFGGSAHQAAPIATAGLTDADLRLRVPDTVLTSLDLSEMCNVTSTGPMWRFNAVAQPSAYFDADIAITSCPAPALVSAVAASPTEVMLTFDRNIADASITAAATQFTIATGLTVSAAASGDTNMVTLTTSAQTPGTTYEVTVANSVTDLAGTGVDAAANMAAFDGFTTPAVVRVNEVTADLTGGCDLIELRVISGGSMAGFNVTERTSTIYTFAAGFTVATNDLIVVHTNVSSGTCNASSATDETTAIDEFPESAHPQNYDTAYDVYSSDTGLTATDNVFQIRDNLDTILDAMLASDSPTGNAASGSETAAATVAAAGEWTKTDGTLPAGGFVDDDFNANAVQDLNATSPDESLQRANDADNNHMGDWTQATSSYGALNAGQTPF